MKLRKFRDRTSFRGARMLRAAACVVVAAVLNAMSVEPLLAENGQEQALIAPGRERALPEAPASLTHHEIKIEGAVLEYSARVGAMDISIDDGRALGRVFFVAYIKAQVDLEGRPLSFVFNGGPGAASAYLHLLALGPRILQLNDNGSIPPPPVRITENPLTWLEFTDLVFIDPVGTGYSQAVEADNVKGQDESGESRFWSFAEDLDAVAEFIRLYLTRTQRWRSPKFLIGESYGGFRAAALPMRMVSEPGVRFNGVVLVSPVLEFSYLQFDPYRLLPWVTLLPAYAATAFHHGKSGVSDNLHGVLAKVESFATSDFLTWLARADGGGHEEVPEELTKHIGLPRDLVVRYRGRIPRAIFAKQLLRDRQRVISLYDGTIASIDPHPAAPILRAGDPFLEGLTAPLTSAFNAYVREQLAFQTEQPYLVLNPAVNRKWDWTSEATAGRAALGTAEDLKEAMSLNSQLKVFIAHGAYDLVTPYLASRLTIRQMWLDPTIEANLRLEIYEGGHMLYTHAAARAALHRDARQFFRRAAAMTD